MAQLSPAVIEFGIPVAAALVYAILWVATRNLSRVGKILVRLAPLGLIVPVMIYLSSVLAARSDITAGAATAGPSTESKVPRQ